MKLILKQKIFSWFDSYFIYDENDEIVYYVSGKLSWGHLFHIENARKELVGIIRQEVLHFLPQYAIYRNDQLIGKIKKQFSLFKPKFDLEFLNWSIHGDFFEWNYQIVSQTRLIATITKEWFHLRDVYVIDVNQESDALYALMIALAIDADKCSRKS